MIRIRKYGQLVDVLLSGLLILFFFALGTTQEQGVFLIVVAVPLSFLSINKSFRNSFFLLHASSWLMFLTVTWNVLFRNYAKANNLSSGIFRGWMTGSFHTPLYGRVNEAQTTTLMVIGVLVVLCFVIFYKQVLTKNSGTIWSCFLPFFIFQGLVWGVFPYDFLIGNNVHYATFSEGLAHFTDVSDLLSNYVTKMPELGVHNSHYPPLLLILLKLEELYIPNFTKIIVFSSNVLSMVFLYRILKLTQTDERRRLLLMTVFSSSVTVMYFWTISPDSLNMLFTLAIMYLMLRFLKDQRWVWTVPLGILLFFYFMTTMLAIFFVSFAFIFILMNMFKNKVEKGRVLRLLISMMASVSIPVILFWMLESFYGFNIIACYLKGINSAFDLMGNEHREVSGYLLRSTGNLLAFAFVAFVPLILLLKNKGVFNYLVIGYLILMAFCGTFFLETERVWIFYFPILFMFSTPDIHYKQREVYLVGFQLFATIIMILNFTF